MNPLGISVYQRTLVVQGVRTLDKLEPFETVEPRIAVRVERTTKTDPLPAEEHPACEKIVHAPETPLAAYQQVMNTTPRIGVKFKKMNNGSVVPTIDVYAC